MSANPNRLDIYFLDVGQGDCTVIIPPDGEGDPILFDCADDWVARRFFADHDLKRLEAVVASHLDVDHIRGMLPFLQQHFADGREVGKLVLGLDRSQSGMAATELVDAALAWDRAPPHPGFRIWSPTRDEASKILASGEGWQVELILPFQGDVLRAQVQAGHANDASAALRIVRGETAVLVGGDASLGAWERLPPDTLRAHTVRTSHHGGDLGRGRQWRDHGELYAAMGAERAVFSVGTHNQYGHPVAEHVAAARRGAQCRVLCTQMTARCHRRPANVRDEALRYAAALEVPYRHEAQRGQNSPPWAGEVPCAGTVLVSMAQDGTAFVWPKPAKHRALIDLLDVPMCRA